MKYYLTLLLFVICTWASAQPTFISLIQRAKIGSVPYSSGSEQMRHWFINVNKQVKLRGQDSVFLVEQLKSIPRIIVNPGGGNGFGDIDCDNTSESRLDNIGRIAIVAVIKDRLSKNYLLHIEIEENDVFPLQHGIIACITTAGKITSWIYSDGAVNAFNRHGTISRDFKIRSDHTIYITEASYGDNTNTYGFYATYKVAANKLILVRRKLLIGK